MMAKEHDAMPRVRGPSLRARRRSLLDWVGDADGATNGDSYKPKLKLRDDYPIEYSCEDAVEGRGAIVSEVWFRYDYELTLNDEQDPIATRRAFEWSLLWNVGVELGLYNCSIDMQEDVESGEGARLLGGVSDLDDADPPLAPSPTRVVALGNDMEDQADLEADTCFSQETGCRPMKGIMNALYTGDKRDAENMVLTLVEKVMATKVVRVKGVEQVQYIGDRDVYDNTPMSLTKSTSDAGNNNSPMRTFGLGIGLAVGAAVVIGLVVGMLVARVVRKRADKKDSETRVSVTSIEILDLEDEKKTGDEDAEEKEGEEEPSNVEVVPSLEEGNEQASADVPQEPQEEGVTPLPKPQPSQSLPSRRGRRRKKKKKKKTRMTLVRSDSVNSMDTITEENEEDQDSDDIGSDFGSEYSTDDEDQDFGMKRTMSTGSLSTDPSFPLEQVVESPAIRKLPPPPV